jgi:aryl-alcohol dehydrogenase-like predicted oxidoreductase
MASWGTVPAAPDPAAAGPAALRARLRGLRAAGPAARIGLGLAALGRPGYINLGHGEDLGADRSPEAMERGAHAVLDAAWAAGVRYLDAARSYGRAEDFLGSWLAARSPEGVTVGSKWGYVYTAGWRIAADPPEVKHHDLATLRAQLGETRERLGRWLALYQIHSATPESGVLEDEAVLEELSRLRGSGVAIGVTTSGASQAATIDRAVGLGLFDAVQATWNLHERAAEAALERAHDAGLVVIVKEALANGRLSPRGADPRLAEAARAAGASEDALALAAVLARPWADLALSGAASVATLASNLAAAGVGWTTALEQRLAVLREDPSDYWARRSALPWI